MEDKLLNEEHAAAQTAENYHRVCDEIAEAAYKAGRDPSEIRLVGATKFKTCAEILPALKAGLAEVGENRAQEFRDKFDFFTAQGVRPHFIGALQTNKAKYVVGKAELIQSVDRLALAEEINRLAQKAGLVQPVLIEINIGGEEQKSGILPGELPELLKLVSDMRNLSVKGLMCVPPAGNEDETRYFFAKMRELFLAAGEFSFPNFAAEQLSMGMSGDYKAAVAEGATMLRIGSAIFGARLRQGAGLGRCTAGGVCRRPISPSANGEYSFGGIIPNGKDPKQIHGIYRIRQGRCRVRRRTGGRSPRDGDCSRGTEKIHGTPRFVNGKCCQPSRSQLRKDDRLSPCQL